MKSNKSFIQGSKLDDVPEDDFLQSFKKMKNQLQKYDINLVNLINVQQPNLIMHVVKQQRKVAFFDGSNISTLNSVIKFNNIQHLLLQFLHIELFSYRQINKNFNRMIRSFYESKYLIFIKSFPKNYLQDACLIKIVNTLEFLNTSRTVDQIKSILKLSISLHDEELFQSIMLIFLEQTRIYKQYKEFIFSKKTLENEFMKEILKDQKLLEQALNLNSNQYFFYIMDEYSDDNKKKIYSDKKFTLKYFSCYNFNGNLDILTEIYRQNNALYIESLVSHADGKVPQDQNWFIVNTIRNYYDMLEFNLNLVEKNKGTDFLSNCSVLYQCLDFSIETNNASLVELFIRFIDVQEKRKSRHEKTPLEYAIKMCRDDDYEIINHLIRQEEGNQEVINTHPINLKCHLLYAIKRQLPQNIIGKLLDLYKHEALVAYRDREHKSLLYHAIFTENTELTREIVHLFKPEDFYQYATDGSYAFQAALKSKNNYIRQIVTAYVEKSLTDEFIKNFRINQPEVPKEMILLQKKLSKVSMKQKFFFRPEKLVKPKRRQSFPKIKLQNFDDYTKQMLEWEKNDPSTRFKALHDKLNKKSDMQVTNLSKNNSPQTRRPSNGDAFNFQIHNESFLRPQKLSYEQKFSIFHQISRKKKSLKFLDKDAFFSQKHDIFHLYDDLFESHKYIDNHYEQREQSHLLLFHGSIYIDNADIIYKPLRQPNKQIPQTILDPWTRRSQNQLINALTQFFKMQILPNQSERKDQVAELMLPVITALNQYNAKFTELPFTEAVDLSKMTITQKIAINNYKQANRGVSSSLQKEYQERQKLVYEESRVREEQEQVQNEMKEKLRASKDRPYIQLTLEEMIPKPPDTNRKSTKKLMKYGSQADIKVTKATFQLQSQQSIRGSSRGVIQQQQQQQYIPNLQQIVSQLPQQEPKQNITPTSIMSPSKKKPSLQQTKVMFQSNVVTSSTIKKFNLKRSVTKVFSGDSLDRQNERGSSNPNKTKSLHDSSQTPSREQSPRGMSRGQQKLEKASEKITINRVSAPKGPYSVIDDAMSPMGNNRVSHQSFSRQSSFKKPTVKETPIPSVKNFSIQLKNAVQKVAKDQQNRLSQTKFKLQRKGTLDFQYKPKHSANISNHKQFKMKGSGGQDQQKQIIVEDMTQVKKSKDKDLSTSRKSKKQKKGDISRRKSDIIKEQNSSDLKADDTQEEKYEEIVEEYYTAQDDSFNKRARFASQLVTYEATDKRTFEIEEDKDEHIDESQEISQDSSIDGKEDKILVYDNEDDKVVEQLSNEEYSQYEQSQDLDEEERKQGEKIKAKEETEGLQKQTTLGQQDPDNMKPKKKSTQIQISENYSDLQSADSNNNFAIQSQRVAYSVRKFSNYDEDQDIEQEENESIKDVDGSQNPQTEFSSPWLSQHKKHIEYQMHFCIELPFTFKNSSMKPTTHISANNIGNFQSTVPKAQRGSHLNPSQFQKAILKSQKINIEESFGNEDDDDDSQMVPGPLFKSRKSIDFQLKDMNEQKQISSKNQPLSMQHSLQSSPLLSNTNYKIKDEEKQGLDKAKISENIFNIDTKTNKVQSLEPVTSSQVEKFGMQQVQKIEETQLNDRQLFLNKQLKSVQPQKHQLLAELLQQHQNNYNQKKPQSEQQDQEELMIEAKDQIGRLQNEKFPINSPQITSPKIKTMHFKSASADFTHKFAFNHPLPINEQFLKRKQMNQKIKIQEAKERQSPTLEGRGIFQVQSHQEKLRMRKMMQRGDGTSSKDQTITHQHSAIPSYRNTSEVNSVNLSPITLRQKYPQSILQKELQKQYSTRQLSTKTIFKVEKLINTANNLMELTPDGSMLNVVKRQPVKPIFPIQINAPMVISSIDNSKQNTLRMMKFNYSQASLIMSDPPPQEPVKSNINSTINFRPNYTPNEQLRYKSIDEQNQYKKIVKNINLIRRLAGSPLRLYPELTSPKKLKPLKTIQTPKIQMSSTDLDQQLQQPVSPIKKYQDMLTYELQKGKNHFKSQIEIQRFRSNLSQTLESNISNNRHSSDKGMAPIYIQNPEQSTKNKLNHQSLLYELSQQIPQTIQSEQPSDYMQQQDIPVLENQQLFESPKIVKIQTDGGYRSHQKKLQNQFSLQPSFPDLVEQYGPRQVMNIEQDHKQLTKFMLSNSASARTNLLYLNSQAKKLSPKKKESMKKLQLDLDQNRN